jgi:lysophospholipase L1-like esterase
MTAKHVALLGDSIFDNAAYVAGGPDVAAQLLGELGSDATVTLLAVDGGITADVREQLRRLPSSATHVVVSAGGNDILHHVGMLEHPAARVADAVAELASARERFAPAHRAMVEDLAATRLPVAVCTIYDGNFDPPLGRLLATALSVFNDAVSRNIHASGLDLVDLRLICDERADYANPIEPAVEGGAKIARVLADYVRETDSRSPRTRVFI